MELAHSTFKDNIKIESDLPRDINLQVYIDNFECFTLHTKEQSYIVININNAIEFTNVTDVFHGKEAKLKNVIQ